VGLTFQKCCLNHMYGLRFKPLRRRARLTAAGGVPAEGLAGPQDRLQGGPRTGDSAGARMTGVWQPVAREREWTWVGHGVTAGLGERSVASLNRRPPALLGAMFYQTALLPTLEAAELHRCGARVNRHQKIVHACVTSHHKVECCTAPVRAGTICGRLPVKRRARLRLC
jgi:hypothetical protein